MKYLLFSAGIFALLGAFVLVGPSLTKWMLREPEVEFKNLIVGEWTSESGKAVDRFNEDGTYVSSTRATATIEAEIYEGIRGRVTYDFQFESRANWNIVSNRLHWTDYDIVDSSVNQPSKIDSPEFLTKYGAEPLKKLSAFLDEKMTRDLTEELEKNGKTAAPFRYLS